MLCAVLEGGDTAGSKRVMITVLVKLTLLGRGKDR